jgi:hypothetical protein
MDPNSIENFYAEQVRSMRRMRARAREAIATPIKALDALPAIEYGLDILIAEMCNPRQGRRIMRVAGLQPIAILAAATIPTYGNAVTVQWPVDGAVIGIRVGTTDGLDATAAKTSVQIDTMDGQTNMFTDGAKDAFMIFTNINTVASPYWPLWIPVHNNERWNVQCANEGTGLDEGFTTQPNISFAYVRGKFQDVFEER